MTSSHSLRGAGAALGRRPLGPPPRFFWTPAALVVALVLAFPAHAAAPLSPRAAEWMSALAAAEGGAVDVVVRAAPVPAESSVRSALEALAEGHLFRSGDGRLWALIDGRLVDPSTHAATSLPADELTPFVVDNALRRALSPILARVRLFSGDPAERLLAATELARSPDPDSMAAASERLRQEADPRVRSRLELALARLSLTSPEVSVRLGAAQTVGRLGTPSMKGDLSDLLSGAPPRRPPEPDARVRSAAEASLARLSRTERITTLLGNFFHGISLGSVLLLAALGLALTFGLLGVINMAHGEMLMLGAYTGYAVQELFQAYWPSHLSLYLVAALPAAFAVCFAVGTVLERTLIRRLYGRPLETLLSTWGVSLLLIQTVRMLFGAQNVTVANPSWLQGGVELADGLVLPYTRLATIAFGIGASAFVWLVLKKTRFGLEVRAVTQHRAMASCVGVRTPWVDMCTFGLGSALAGLGGLALSQLGNVGPELGQEYVIDAFLVVVLGGVGKIAGTVAAAMALGLVNKLLEPFAGAVLGKIVVLVLVVLFIQQRPQGLFAPKGRAEA